MSVIDVLAAADPARRAELPRPGDHEARALRERVLRTDVRRTAAGRRTLVLAIAIAAVATVGIPRALQREPVGASPAAAAVLEQLATATAPAGHTGAGRYAYTEARTIFSVTDTDAPAFTALVPSVQETWLAANGSGRIRTVHGTPYFPSARDRSRWLTHGSPKLGASPGSVAVERLAPDTAARLLAERDPATLDDRELDALVNAPAFLPLEPDRLERLLREYAERKDPPAEDMMFNQLEDLLTNPYASAALRAASYRVLARMKGVELAGSIRDPAGRDGTALEFPAGYGDAVEHRLIVDPATGAVLTEQTLLVHATGELDGRPGQVVGEVTYVRSGWVSAPGELPAGQEAADR